MAGHFAGVEAVFLHPRAFGDSADRLLALAAERGVRRVVALSAMNIDDPFDLQPSRWRGDRNKEAEEAAVASGLAWTSLRASSFAGNTLQAWGAQIRAGDVVRYVHAGFRESLLDERDLAEVAARALLTDELLPDALLPGELAGRRLELTGPESLSHEETVAVIGAALGRPLRFEEVPSRAVAAHLRSPRWSGPSSSCTRCSPISTPRSPTCSTAARPRSGSSPTGPASTCRRGVPAPGSIGVRTGR